jgi:hypothetical protein
MVRLLVETVIVVALVAVALLVILLVAVAQEHLVKVTQAVLVY